MWVEKYPAQLFLSSVRTKLRLQNYEAVFGYFLIVDIQTFCEIRTTIL